MNLSANYVLLDANGAKTEAAQAAVRFNGENLSISPEAGSPLYFSLRDFSSVEQKDYQVRLALRTGECIVLGELGYQFEDFVRQLLFALNEITLRDLLVSESAQSFSPAAEFAFSGVEGQISQGKCVLRLYATSLAVLPDTGGVKIFPFREIAEIREGDYKISVKRENGDTIVLSQMGRDFEPFCRALSKAVNEMLLRTQALLKEIDPALGPLVLRKAAQLIKEGKAVSKKEIDALAPSLWAAVEKKLCADAEFKSCYDYLKGLSSQDKICFGFKRGLAMAGDYLFVLVPLHGGAAGANAAAFETLSLSPDGKDARATYFFRLTGRAAFENLKTGGERDAAADVFTTVFNTCMSAVNFRRAPVFLTDAQLAQPRGEKYRIAAHAIPELALLRKLFIGRVVHADNWKERVAELLAFNAQSDSARWLGGDTEEYAEDEAARDTAAGG